MNTKEKPRQVPQAQDIESVVLGAALLGGNAIDVISDILDVEDFYLEANQAIYCAIKKLKEQHTSVDIITLCNQLEKDGKLQSVGGPAAVSLLTSRVGSDANVEFHARIIAQKSVARKLLTLAHKAANSAYDETVNVHEQVLNLSNEVRAIIDGFKSQSAFEIAKVIPEAISEIKTWNDEDQESNSVLTGFSDLDIKIGGLQRSDMIVIAARPSQGKTAFATKVLRNAAVIHKKSVLIFSLEMSAVQIAHRLLSDESKVELQKMRTGKVNLLELNDLNLAAENLSKAKIFIDDSPTLSIDDIQAKAKRIKNSDSGLDLVIVDYLGLIANSTQKAKGGTREQEVAAISRGLKIMAKELDVPVVILSQLSRAVEQRGGDRRPILSDIRESGAVEQDADIVSFLYRPEYYGITEDHLGNSLRNAGFLIIAKNRNGSVGEVKIKFEGRYATFDNFGITSIYGAEQGSNDEKIEF